MILFNRTLFILFLLFPLFNYSMEQRLQPNVPTYGVFQPVPTMPLTKCEKFKICITHPTSIVAICTCVITGFCLSLTLAVALSH